MPSAATPFDPASVTIPSHRDTRRALRRFLSPRWLFMIGHRPEPLSQSVGQDRGTPVDRPYIESFLNHHKAAITGRVLEIKDRDYTQRFGTNVTASAVLDANRDNKDADLYDDIRALATIPDNSYDCFIITQVLQYVDDLHASARAIHRVLAPDGTALITVPTLGKLDGSEDNVAGNYWRLTADSARFILAHHFHQLEIVPWGNLRLAIAFLSGLSAQDLSTPEMTRFDARYTCGVLIRATKDLEPPPPQIASTSLFLHSAHENPRVSGT
jgi:SAM-dependent methyltransferase